MSNPSKQLELLRQLMKEYVDSTSNLLKLLKIEPKHQKKIDSWANKWNNVAGMIEEISRFITPITALEVKYPKFFTLELMETWAFWKDYLQEQHNIIIKSRAEIKQIAFLAKISDQNPDVAIEILDDAMGTNKWNFSKKTFKTEETKTPAKNESSY